MSSAVHIVYLKPDGTEESIEFDAVVRETLTDDATITESPVEDGANVADNVRQELATVALEGVVSSSPHEVPKTNMEGVQGSVKTLDLDNGQSATVLQFDDLPPRVRSIYTLLLALKSQASLVRVITSVRDYESLLIKTIEVNRDSPNDAIAFSLTFREIRIVASVTAPTPIPSRGNRARNRGNQPAQAQASGTPSESLWHRLAGL